MADAANICLGLSGRQKDWNCQKIGSASDYTIFLWDSLSPKMLI